MASSTGNKGPQLAPPDDLYTTLLIIAAALLLIGIVYVSIRSFQLFDSLWPAGGG